MTRDRLSLVCAWAQAPYTIRQSKARNTNQILTWITLILKFFAFEKNIGLITYLYVRARMYKKKSIASM
jgi:hypothetical protein